MAEFISNSAILPTIRPWRRAYSGAQLQPRVRKMAEFGINSARASGDFCKDSSHLSPRNTE